MTPTIDKVETQRLNATLEGLHDALIGSGKPGDAREVVADESRRLAEQIARFMPPQTRAIGEKSVEREVKSLFSAADPEMIDTIGSMFGIKNVEAHITSRQTGEPLRIQWDEIDPEGARMKERHYQERGKSRLLRIKERKPDGKSWKARVVVPHKARADYVKEMQSRVGRLKASFAEVARQLGTTRIGGWIARHIPTPKSIFNGAGLANLSKPSVTFGSTARGVSRFTDFIRSAMRARSSAISRRIKLITSGYAKDVARGIRAQTRARRVRAQGTGGSHAIG